jgi:hypothetical protein
MNITLSQNSAPGATPRRARFSLFKTASIAALIFAAATSLFAQDDRRRRGDTSGGGGGSDRGGGRGDFNPQDMQARLLSGMRERFGVTNDDEWGVIADRLTKVMELRRSSMGSMAGAMFFGRGGPGGDSRGGTDRGSSSSRTSRSGSGNDVAALQAAIQDKLPDAEIKARLDRVREQRKDNEAKLAKAQEELRAVLTVRQEAVAVLAGLLQ